MDFMGIAENMYWGIIVSYFYDLARIHAHWQATARAGNAGCKGLVAAGKSPKSRLCIKEQRARSVRARCWREIKERAAWARP